MPDSRHSTRRGHRKAAHKDAAHRRDRGLLGGLLQMGEDRLGEIAGDLLERKAVQKALERALVHAYDTKARVDRSLTRALRAMNLPTRREVDKLKSEVRALRAEMAALTTRRAAPRKSRARRTPSPGKKNQST